MRLLVILFLLFIIPVCGQFSVRESKSDLPSEEYLKFYELSSKRKIISLDGVWSLYPANKPEKVSKIGVPSAIDSDNEYIFEKQFEISKSLYNLNNFELVLFGLSYSAEISVNKKVIFQHKGGDFPFSVHLPKDFLFSDKKNTLTIKINPNLTGMSTIPVKNRFLAPKYYSGIFKDIFIRIIPNQHISNVLYKYEMGGSLSNVKLLCDFKIENNEFKGSRDTLAIGKTFDVRMFVSTDTSSVQLGSVKEIVEVDRGRNKNVSFVLNLSGIRNWSIEKPSSYKLKLQLFKGDVLIDEVVKSIAFYSLKGSSEGMLFNGGKITLNGVTYIPSSYTFDGWVSYNKMEEDIRLIKKTGFNAVRFLYFNPHPYLLHLCERYGLLAFIENPIRGIPNQLMEEYEFIEMARDYVKRQLDSYNNFSIVAGYGLGSGFSEMNQSSKNFLSEVKKVARSSFNKLVFASFLNAEVENLGLDLYGLELLNSSFNELSSRFNEMEEKLGEGKVFISEAGYLSSYGNSNGYINPYTTEAKAKFYEEILSYFEENPEGGFFLNTLYDYEGGYRSIVSGFNRANRVSVGVLADRNDLDYLPYRLVYSYLNKTEKVTVPLGVKKDNSPMVFIIFGVFLAIMMGLMANSSRRFREDASRALLRPYNFFSDVRDLRILSSFYTFLVAIIIAGTLALINSSVMTSLRDNVLFEKILLSFGSNSLVNYVSYLAWHPIESLLIQTGLFIMLLMFVTLLIRFGAFFVQNKVYIIGAFHTAIFSFLPVILLIPIAIVLYRLLANESFITYLYGMLIVLGIWVFYRMLKGIAVVYDTLVSRVYVSVFLVMFLTAMVLVIVLNSSNSFLAYLLHNVKYTKIL